MQVESRCEDVNIEGEWSAKIYHRCTTCFNRKIHQFDTPKKDIVMNLLVLLLTKQTNLWICGTEQVLFRDCLQILFPSNLSILINFHST